MANIREEEALLARDQLWPARVKRLKHWLEENSSEKIPELQLLTDRQWKPRTRGAAVWLGGAPPDYRY